MAKRGKYGSWGEEDLLLAVAAYRNGDYGLNECSRIYNVPKATIKRHADGKNANSNEKKLLGRQPTFNQEMEEMLKNHLLKFEETFFGFTIKDVRKLAFDLAEKHGLPHNFNRETKCAGKKWYYNFMRRNPTLSLRRPEATSLARIKGFNKENVMHFFDILDKSVKDFSISANTIFNVDESGFSTVQKNMQKVIALKGKKQVGGATSGERGVNTTMVCAVSASGIYVPPMIIFKRKIWLEDLRIGAPLGSLVTISDTGYINSDLFLAWLKHFKSFVNSSKDNKVLLLLDGHTTHSKNLEACEFARDNGIILLQLPGHTSHRLQPLDVAFFGPLQKYFVQAQDTFMREHQTEKITQLQICRLLSDAYGKAATVGNAASAFKGSGCWPVNRHVFKECDFAGADTFNVPQPSSSTVESSMPSTSTVDSPMPSTSESRLNKPQIDHIQRPLHAPVSSSSEADNSDEDVDYVPERNRDFKTLLNKISPLPKRNLFSAPRGQGGRGRGRGRPKTGPQKAVLITSSPYKLELERTKEEKKKKEEEKERKKKEKEERGEEEKIKHLTGVKRKSKIKKEPKNPKLKHNENNWYCFICEESVEEDMIMCLKCSSWVHTRCAGVSNAVKMYFCPNCRS